MRISTLVCWQSFVGRTRFGRQSHATNQAPVPQNGCPQPTIRSIRAIRGRNTTGRLAAELQVRDRGEVGEPRIVRMPRICSRRTTSQQDTVGFGTLDSEPDSENRIRNDSEQPDSEPSTVLRQLRIRNHPPFSGGQLRVHFEFGAIHRFQAGREFCGF